MKRTARTRKAPQSEQGYALVLIMFFLAILVLTTVVAAPTVISSIQREKEKEMVWRGRQYTRAIRMYYAKMKRFPTSLDDLTKPKTGLRFMRQAYKDPMNGTDGSWRLIYVGPSGQLIGSLNPANQTFGMMPGIAGMGANGALGSAANSFGNSSFGNSGNSSFGNSSFGNSSFGNSSFGNSSFGNNSSQFGNTASANGLQAGVPGGTSNGVPGQAGSSTDPNAQNGSTDQLGVPQPLATMDSSNTIGGNIIGVGSKINKSSFMWYNKAKNYRQFEFIWDPSKDQRVGGASQGIGTPVNGINSNGTNSNGMNSNGFGTGFGSNSGNTGQNPSQQNPGFNGNQNPGAMPPLQAPQ
jgi:type II secretory pathway pseudopilin PulG